MSDQAHCNCDVFVHPAEIVNPPGLTAVGYRAGDFLSFRRALLLSRPGETALAAWRPGGGGDLAEQLVEWWAVLADILTFYNERIINEAFLGTATLDEAVKNLIRLLGYRPRPGLAAHGAVAALMSGRKPVTIKRGFSIQSKPGPGKQPQVFEVDADTIIVAPDAVAVDPPPDGKLLHLDGGRSSLLLAGSVTSIKPGQRFLLRRRRWNGSAADRALVTVDETKKEKTPRGATNTRVVFSGNIGLANEPASDWLLLRSTQSAPLFAPASEPIVSVLQRVALDDDNSVEVERSPRFEAEQKRTADTSAKGFFSRFDDRFQQPDFVELPPERQPTPPPREPDVLSQTLHLDGVYSALAAGDALLLERSGDAPAIAFVKSISRQVWYANAPNAAQPDQPPPKGNDTIPIPILHSAVAIDPLFLTKAARGRWNDPAAAVMVSFAWVEAGRIIAAPRTTFSPGGAVTLLSADAHAADLATPRGVQLEDANGAGTSGRVSATAAGTVAFSALDPAPALAAPLRVLANLLHVSRGKSVANEILGSGDATAAGQSFVLKKSPLTYLASGDGYRSTLRVWVAGIEWREAQSFYGQPPEATVFVTKEDAEQKTHVLFGDGVNGALLPSGANNVVASYRYGSGAELPEAGSLNVVLAPQPGLRGIRNPVPVFGGADPDAAAKVRALAPRSVLTFGRAVSADDYEVIAAGAGGVQRARAMWAFDAALQRAVVTIWVGDDDGAVKSARAALAASNDPNSIFVVKPANAIDCSLKFTLRIRSDFAPEPVVAAVRAALVDPERGLFGSQAVRIGQVIYDSEIERACLAVPGTIAVHGLQLKRGAFPDLTARHDPGAGWFFRLAPPDIDVEQA